MTTGQPLVGALIFPVSLVMIVLLGLELVTGSFALVPLARLEGTIAFTSLLTRCPAMAFAGEPQRRQTYTLRGLQTLPVSL